MMKELLSDSSGLEVHDVFLVLYDFIPPLDRIFPSVYST
jgi:hypothetical protein